MMTWRQANPCHVPAFAPVATLSVPMKNTSLPAVPPKVRRSSVVNAVYVLKAFADDSDELDLNELSALLDVARSTTYRLAAALVESGMLERSAETGRYRLGRAAFALRSVARRDFARATQQ
jgi:predicted transcriptional regulator of viral defense system